MLQNGTPHRHETAAHTLNRRRAERHDHAERVVLTTQWGDVAGTLIDLSVTGAQMRLVNGLVPVDGDDATLRLVDGRYIPGTVAWIGDDTIGLSFDQPLPSVEDILWVEQRGSEWFYGAAHGSR